MLPMQGTGILSLVRELDLTSSATKTQHSQKNFFFFFKAGRIESR